MQFNLADLFESVVDKIPEKEALIVRGQGRWTYRELEAEANRLAHFLLARGVASATTSACTCTTAPDT
jgi:non-ribosomal peptide synthetase component F